MLFSLKVDFANRHIGGGVLGGGHVQVGGMKKELTCVELPHCVLGKTFKISNMTCKANLDFLFHSFCPLKNHSSWSFG